MSYGDKMFPYAAQAARALNVPTGFVLAMWDLESGTGQSRLARENNNHAGIKKNSRGADGPGFDNVHAHYNSINSFVADYIRVLGTLSYYADFRSVADAGGSLDDLINAIHKSPYATDPLYGTKLAARYKARGYYEYDNIEPPSQEPLPEIEPGVPAQPRPQPREKSPAELVYAYYLSLKDNWQKLKDEHLKEMFPYLPVIVVAGVVALAGFFIPALIRLDIDKGPSG